MTQQESNLAQIAALAVEQERATDCPALLMIAQWAIESAWGEKPVGHANYFGIKRAARHARFCTVLTREVIHGQTVYAPLEFADYDSLADACKDYAWLITQGAPYRAAWTAYRVSHDLPALIASVAQTYATDPGYARLANALAAQLNVRAAYAAAVAATL